MKISNLDALVMAQENLSSLKRADIEAMQLEKLNKVLEKEHNRQGFYKHLPERISCLEELSELPFTDSEQLRDNSGAMLLLSQSQVQRVLTERTSGSSGTPKRVFYTAGDLENTVKLFMAGLSELVYPGSVTYIAMPFSGPYGLGELIAEAIERLGAKAIKAGPFLKLGQIRELFEVEKPDTYVGMPSNLLFILRSLGKMSLKRALISGDACPESVVSACEEILGCRLFPHYGSREMALGGAVTCPAHEGMHLRENHVIAEIVDENGKNLPAGQWGELVITTIGMEAMPLIRYKTGDRTRILPFHCECGSELLRLDSVKRLNSPEIVNLDESIFSLPRLCDYAVEAEGGLVCLECTVNGKTDPEDIKKAAEAVLPGKKFDIRLYPAGDNTAPMYKEKRKIL